MSLLPADLDGAERVIVDASADPARLGELFERLYPLGLGPRGIEAQFDESRRLIWLLARNPSTPPATLARIAGMSYPSARAVAQNPGFVLTLMIDPLCSEPPTQRLVSAVAMRWPSDNDLMARVGELLDRAAKDAALGRELGEHCPRLVAHDKIPSGRRPAFEALMYALSASALPFGIKNLPPGTCMTNVGHVPCAQMLHEEARLEKLLTTRFALRFERWFAGVDP